MLPLDCQIQRLGGLDLAIQAERGQVRQKFETHPSVICRLQSSAIRGIMSAEKRESGRRPPAAPPPMRGGFGMAITVGTKAPDFELMDTEGNAVRLSSFAGKKNVVLAFHPLAFTRFCTAQMLALDIQLGEFRKRDAEVFGISVDSTDSKRAWAATMGLKYLPILADFYPHGAVAESYGLLRPVGSAERAMVVIDKAGVVRWVKVYPVHSVPEPADALAALDGLA